jgi:TolB-like protein
VEKSIAVLPFENRGNDPENANFALGIHDDLMTQLQRIGDLKLIAGSSVSKTDLDAPVETTGQRLGATYIMKGTVERVLDRIRVSVVLIVAAEAQQAWAGSFDRELSAVNLFSIRDEITSAITENLQAVLSPAEQALVFDLPTESMKAYRLYSRGRQLLSTRRTKDIQQALQAFNLAVEIDPDFALGWVGVADTNFLLSNLAKPGSLLECCTTKLRNPRKQKLPT